MPEAAPRQVLRHQPRDLSEREDHDEVEEELKGCNSLLPLDRLTVHLVGRLTVGENLSVGPARTAGPE